MLAVAVVVLLKLLLDPLITQQSPFLLIAAAVIVGAWFGGLGPGILATLLGALAADYFFLEPVGSFTGLGVGLLPVTLFLLQGLLISALVEALHSARQRAESRALEIRRKQGELRQSEERFRLLVEGVGDYALFMLDSEGRVTTWNKGAEHLFGYPEEEIVGEPGSVLFTPDDIRGGAFELELRKAEEEGRAVDERWHVRKDGSRFWASGFVRPVRDNTGDLRGFAKVARDVTELKEAEDRLRESEERFRTTFEQAAVGVAHVGPDGRWLRINNRLCEITGYGRDELLEMTFQDITHPDDLQRDLDHLHRLLAGESRIYSAEMRYLRKDGSAVWVNLTASTVVDTSDHLKYFITVVEDITERKKAEEALNQSEERYRAVVKQSTDGIYLVDGETRRILETNPALQTMLGYSAEELHEMELHEIVAHDREDVEANIERTLSEGSRFIRERRYLRKDGTEVDVEVAASAIYYGGKRVICAAIRDITERKRAEEALRQSERVYRSVVEQAAENIFFVDLEALRILEANAAFYDSLGYSPEELGAITLYDIVAHDRESIDRNVNRIVQEGQRSIGERKYRRKDGSLIDVEVSASAVPYRGREAMCIVAHDVTERKRAGEALRFLSEASAELSSSLDYRATLGGVARLAVPYLADWCAVDVLEENGNVLRLAVEHADRAKVARAHELHQRYPPDLDAPRGVAQVLRSGRSELYPEIPDELLVAAARDEEHLRMLRDLGFSSAIAVPLVARDRTLGVITLASAESGRRYDEADLELAEELARRAALAVDNARLYDEAQREIAEREQVEGDMRQSLGVLLALREAGQVLGSTLESEEIVSRLLEIMRGVSNLTAAVISVQDEEGSARIWRSAGLQGLWRRARFEPEAAAARRTALDEGEQRLFRLLHPEHRSEQLVGLCLPLRSRDRVLGVLEAYGPESLADRDTVELLHSLASQAASALENAQFYEELGERQRMLQDLIGKLLRAQEEERRLVAYEVHDGLAQVATAAHQHLQAFAERHAPSAEGGRRDLERILRLVRETVSDARRIIADLRPTTLDDLGLAATISQEVERLREEGYQILYREDLGDERLPVAAEIALFRVAQEALTNVRKHAQTEQVRIELLRMEDKVRLEVQDYGRGFDPAAASAESGPGARVGLAGMRERIGMLGGRLEIHSQPDEGTSVAATVHLSQVP